MNHCFRKVEPEIYATVEQNRNDIYSVSIYWMPHCVPDIRVDEKTQSLTSRNYAAVNRCMSNEWQTISILHFIYIYIYACTGHWKLPK